MTRNRFQRSRLPILTANFKTRCIFKILYCKRRIFILLFISSVWKAWYYNKTSNGHINYSNGLKISIWGSNWRSWSQLYICKMFIDIIPQLPPTPKENNLPISNLDFDIVTWLICRKLNTLQLRWIECFFQNLQKSMKNDWLEN